MHWRFGKFLLLAILSLAQNTSIFAQSKNIWISAAEIAQRPTTGEAWNRLLEAADSVDTLAVEGGHNSEHDTYTMASCSLLCQVGGRGATLNSENHFTSLA